MRHLAIVAAFCAAGLAPAAQAAEAPAPAEIVAAAPAGDWVAIAPDDLMVMDLAPGPQGKPRRVVIQLMPPPFSQGWIGNIRKLVAARFWDGTSVNRVQDNYVVQWGDGEAEDPKKAKKLPDGLVAVPESGYHVEASDLTGATDFNDAAFRRLLATDPYGMTSFFHGWPVGVISAIGKDGDLADGFGKPANSGFAAIHCYAMLGVGRNMSPDTGSGAELYTVIGHAPRHLDRNIALVGRVIEGIEHLSSLPRGTGALGFYETPAERTAILTVRLGGEVPGLPAYQYLSTESDSFAAYADARGNRRDAFFIRPAGGADICNVPVPVRRAPAN